MSNIKLNYDDITIIPERITDISSRSECNPYDEQGYLPIFASCMSSVVSVDNVRDFNAAKIHTVIPRSYSMNERLKWVFDEYNFVAFSLKETEDLFLKEGINVEDGQHLHVCIDLANGHMKCLLELVKKLKVLYGDKMVIMTGNIANPETYRDYEEVGVDFCRCTIGSGSVCLTASNTSCFFPSFSLLKETYEIKNEIGGKCKIVADGGIRGYRDIQKALIYADYVMIGGLFNKAMESAGKTTYGNFYWNIRGKKIFRPITTLFKYGKEIPRTEFGRAFAMFKEGKLSIWKEMFGMSHKIAQALILSANTQTVKNLKTSEGLLKYQKVEYDLQGWAQNEFDYLRSAMSYTNSRTLDEYKDKKWVQNIFIAYNK